MQQFNWHLHGLLRLVLEGKCPLCQRSTAQSFCSACQQQVYQCCLNPSSRTVSQDRPSDCSEMGHAGMDRPVPDLPVVAWGRYEGALKRAIAALKYNGNPHLAQPLGRWLADAWLTTTPAKSTARITTAGIMVVPIPIHPDRKKQRGFNQAELLAQHFCAVTRLPLAANGLERHRQTEAQFKLSASEREQNLTGAFSLGNILLKQKWAGSVLLLDDIYTTGATVRSAAQTLRRHGIRVQGVVVLARSVQ